MKTVKTSIQHLSGKEQNDLRHISKRIVQNIAPARIFLFGNRTVYGLNRSCFLNKKKVATYTAMYDLVIIIRDEEPLDEVVIDRLIENIARSEGQQANILVYRNREVARAINKGNSFFIKLCRSAIMLHSNGHPCPTDLRPLSPIKWLSDDVQYIQGNQNCAMSLLSEAVGIRNRNSPDLALCQVKQSITLACRSLIYAYLGYDEQLYNFEKCLNLSLNITTTISAIFPCNTKEEIRLFQLLRTIDLQPPNNDELNHTDADFLILMDRAKECLAVCKKLVDIKLTEIQKRASAPSNPLPITTISK